MGKCPARRTALDFTGPWCHYWSMQQLPYRRGGFDRVRAVAYGVAGVALTAAAAVVGFFLFGVLLLVAITVVTAVAGRVWWLSRRVRRGVSQSESQYAREGQRADDLTADYRIVDRDQR